MKDLQHHSSPINPKPQSKNMHVRIIGAQEQAGKEEEWMSVFSQFGIDNNLI